MKKSIPILFFLFALGSSQAWASELRGKSADELLKMKGNPKGLTKKSRSKIKVNTICESENGFTYKNGDQGYQECLDRQSVPVRGQDPNRSGTVRSISVGIE